MDLQTQRRLEQFLRLSDLPSVRITPRMEFVVPPYRLYIEYLDERILLSLARQIEAPHRVVVLKSLLNRCQPARLQGVPLRAYVLRNHQVLSCSPAPESEVNHWIACYHTMRRLLDAHFGEN
ncbi:secretion system apparatus [Mycoavidus cysteinexigens]|uniref:Secretion system apparatus n=1 Tax=Mycoavidus cysteinexigens TaxID=1553431 RepID=A0A2Z6ETN4_9BURK|nr:type III secretion chaperone SycN [Mycoavidus cysteinexigens]BBE08767.1 secretion system apparatus [Mycoavidus cysteinexigens]GAM52519.1 type III secretion protein SsaM [bacterium endosymbiont of Mortierella elongata FMR23-6]GLR01589.1 hypothetical protein GCM10007934_14010 [Mycoavidus cysteinexigens]